MSFEADYLNVPRMLELAGLPARRADRDAAHPLLIAGGRRSFEIGADRRFHRLLPDRRGRRKILPEFLDVWARAAGEGRGVVLDAVAARVSGAYVPAHFAPRYDGAALVDLDHVGQSARVERRLLWDLNRFATTTRVLSDEAVFGDMVVEAGHGCQWGCRFCAAGFMYRPIRTRDPRQLAAAVDRGLRRRRTIGLVGAEMASVPGVDGLAELAVARGGRLSPSSLKADCVTPRLAARPPAVRAASRWRRKPAPSACAASSTRTSAKKATSCAPSTCSSAKAYSSSSCIS
ncbi:MAG: hypothetical protein U0802_22480 [Candidatus Binatia bacterium]